MELVILKTSWISLMEGDEGYFGFVSNFSGLWGQGGSLDQCKEKLRSTVWHWLSFSADDLVRVWG